MNEPKPIQNPAPTTEQLLKLLFPNPEAGVCWADDEKGSAVRPLSELLQQLQTTPLPIFYTINTLDTEKDNNPILPYHSADRPRRANANVTGFRTILLEFDGGDLDEQKAAVFGAGLPLSAIVYSGSKSLHFLVCLDKPCANAEEYKTLVEKLYDLIKKHSPNIVPDEACKNPSRLTRFPGAVRPETGRVQRLLAVYGYVNREDLEKRLTKEGIGQRSVTTKKAAVTEEVFYQKNRDNRWNKCQAFAGLLRREGLGRDAIYECLKAFVSHHCDYDETVSDQKMQEMANWVVTYPPGALQMKGVLMLINGEEKVVADAEVPYWLAAGARIVRMKQ